MQKERKCKIISTTLLVVDFALLECKQKLERNSLVVCTCEQN